MSKFKVTEWRQRRKEHAQTNILFSNILLKDLKDSETNICCKIIHNFRSSHRTCSVRKDVLRNFAKLLEKHLGQSLFLNKVAGLRSVTLLKKRLWQRCFPVNFATFLRTPFLQNTSRRLVLFILIKKMSSEK